MLQLLLKIFGGLVFCHCEAVPLSFTAVAISSFKRESSHSFETTPKDIKTEIASSLHFVPLLAMTGWVEAIALLHS